jgi:AhpD family alkylhydroperoxidase
VNALRIKYFELSKDALAGFLSTQKAIDQGPLEKTLVQLVYQRVSLINGCAYCLAKHAKLLRDSGESNERIDALAGWRASELYTPRERAVLAWTDSVSRIEATCAPVEEFEGLKEHLDSREISDLTMAIAVMNAMNRLAISMRR